MSLTAHKNEFYEGFTMTFANGYTISVQFGGMNYCSRNEDNKAISAEIAIWDKDNTWYNFGYDNVKGHCSPDEIVTWMRKAKECDYTGEMWVLYNTETFDVWHDEYKIYVYDNKDEAMEDYWGDTCVPKMVKEMSRYIKEKVLTQELNEMAINLF